VRVLPPFRSLSLRLNRRRLAWLAALGVLACGSGPALAGPQPLPPVRSADHAPTLQDLIAEASVRFGVPASWLVGVMSVESRGRADVLSPKGAIGLMQVMPDTYADMRARYGLGANPWDPRDNLLAGAAYLRLLYDRYGAPGFLVAYNAGPGRWDDYRLRARPLPAETVAYLARLGPVVGGSVLHLPTFAGWAAPRSPLASPIFVHLANVSNSVVLPTERERIVRTIDANASVVRATDTIFVSRPGAADAQQAAQSGEFRGADLPLSTLTSSAASPPSSSHRNPLFPERASGGSKP